MSEKSNEREEPDVGLIPDEDLPEDLQPTEDNPLAKDPDQDPDESADDESTDETGEKVEGMPDMGNPSRS
jgi:hypothetical protein